MIYSVFNMDTVQYDYFDGPGLNFLEKPPISHAPISERGIPLEQALITLPSAAVPVGSGDAARGRVAIRPGTLAGLVGLGGTETPLGLGAAALFLGALALWLLIGGRKR